ncbi:MAG: UvrB/UvrC motif-containing protein [Clostridia bacterium]|nr:UvrB/UvrC motif-containing protein [Clostridia bacterium]
MLCQQCKRRPATVHVTRITDGKKLELSLCEECSREYQPAWGLSFNPDFSIHKFLASLLEQEPFMEGAERSFRQPRQCDLCGLTYNDFAQTGRLGCEKCYLVFEDRLDPLLRRMQAGTQHAGKVPRRTGGVMRLKQELKRLKNTLRTLVAREEFEKAAEVRDRIRELEKEVEGKGR